MKFGVNSLLFTDTFVDKDLALLSKCRDMGFEVMEVTPVDPDVFPAKRVREVASDLEMSININFALPETANSISSEPSVRSSSVALSKQIIDICAETNAEIYCGANFAAWKYLSGHKRTEDEWEWGVECMREVAEYARQQCDVLIGVEVLNRFESHFLNTADDGVRFIKDVGLPNVKVHLDTFHMIREEDDMAGAIRACGADLGYFHACGSHRGVPGRDLVPWKETFTALKESGYSGPVTIESFHPDLSIAPKVAVWRDFASSPEALATEGLAFLKKLHDEVYMEKG